uniref:Uncharacterized protein n=1 Tax=Strongyloides venezuelensis TaxID=75913 RepID=A0A0K0G5B6_STRVS
MTANFDVKFSDSQTLSVVYCEISFHISDISEVVSVSKGAKEDRAEELVKIRRCGKSLFSIFFTILAKKFSVFSANIGKSFPLGILIFIYMYDRK